MPDFPSTLFITGTDTGVGKTLCTALLGLHLQSRGLRVGAMKPFASGCERDQNGVLQSEDATFLIETLQLQDELDLVCPCRWEEPLAPYMALQREGTPERDIWTPFVEAYRELQTRYDVVLVEGVGGLMVPVGQHADGTVWTCVEMANFLAAPVVVVARRILGTINHTTLTLRTPLRQPAHFAGVIWSDASEVAADDVAANNSPALVESLTGITRWGQVPHLPNLSRDALVQAAGEFLQFPQNPKQKAPRAFEHEGLSSKSEI